jgi:hypothetical protein
MAVGAGFILFTAMPVHGQAGNTPDEHHGHESSSSEEPHTALAHRSEHEQHDALMTGPLGVSRARMGSGTSWLPDSSPMYGLMGGKGQWGFMVHGNIFAGYDWFGGERGSDQVISVNSVMGMAWRDLGPGELMFRAMLSAEPLTVGTQGYPLILQTGETAGGEPLHDRQHPHDLFMELAAIYVVPLTRGVALQLYLAPAGEPALGPTAFPHRISAMADPLAPLGHHWQDSTHIAFGVLTAALFTRSFKLDASWFNGREPDEYRWDLDLRIPDSYSGRFTWAPGESWSLQASYGYLASPEALEPDLSIHRITASATHNLRLGAQGNLATTLVFGQNIPSEGPATPAFLLESTWSPNPRHSVFGRAEYVRKTGHDLVLPEELEHTAFSTGMLGLGYVVHLDPVASLVPGVGVRGSLGLVEAALEPFYGTRLPLGAMVFMQLRPAPMSM